MTDLIVLWVGDTANELEKEIVDQNGTAIDVSTATTKQIRLCNPDGDWSAYTASFSSDGTDGKIYYALTGSEFTAATVGDWEFQGRVVLASGADYRTSGTGFKVKA